MSLSFRPIHVYYIAPSERPIGQLNIGTKEEKYSNARSISTGEVMASTTKKQMNNSNHSARLNKVVSLEVRGTFLTDVFIGGLCWDSSD